jgi:hypothetical protein
MVCLFCVLSLEVKGGCLFCRYWWNYWPSLFKLPFHKVMMIVLKGCILNHHRISSLLFTSYDTILLKILFRI